MVLALPSLKKIPLKILFPSICSCAAAFFLGWIGGVGGADYARFIFVPGAFMFSLASAISIAGLVKWYKFTINI